MTHPTPEQKLSEQGYDSTIFHFSQPRGSVSNLGPGTETHDSYAAWAKHKLLLLWATEVGGSFVTTT